MSFLRGGGMKARCRLIASVCFQCSLLSQTTSFQTKKKTEKEGKKKPVPARNLQINCVYTFGGGMWWLHCAFIFNNQHCDMKNIIFLNEEHHLILSRLYS